MVESNVFLGLATMQPSNRGVDQLVNLQASNWVFCHASVVFHTQRLAAI